MLFKFFDLVRLYVYPALLVLFFFGLTVFIHEFGHYLMARRRRMIVERFFIGFGPRIFSWKRAGIEYGVAWLPFGGYVALPQMGPLEAIEGKTDQAAAELPVARPVDKIFVAVAGPFMNLVLAFVIATVLWRIGMPAANHSTVIGWVEPNSPEELAGLHSGDRIIQLNGKAVSKWTDILTGVALSFEPTVNVVLMRGSERIVCNLETTYEKEFGIKMTGLYPPGRPVAVRARPGSPADRAGIQPQDEFLAIEGVPVYSRAQLIELISKRADKPTHIKLLRAGVVVVSAVTPVVEPQAKVARIGVELTEQIARPGPKPWEQFSDVFEMLGNSVYAVIHHKQTGVSVKSFAGPVGILGGWWGEFSSGGMRRGLWLAIVLNINLAIFNLLPLPVLDGGHIVFALIETIIRKPVNARFVRVVTTGFAAILIGFMLYITFNDIQKFLPHKQPVLSVPSTNEPAPATAAP
ncbi:MAG: RIP metalloprotease RseP [Verrucomicrobiota bacterium]|jgi:regulator of sigma E protease